MNNARREKQRYDSLALRDGETSSNYYLHAGPELRLRILLREAAKIGPRTVLEVGCADGHVMDWLRIRLGPAPAVIYGIDISQISLKRAKDKGLQLLALSDAQSLPFIQGCCDMVIAAQVLEHVPEHKKALRQAWSVLRPGGHLLLTVPMADWFKLYKGLAVRSLVKFIDEETHRREWSLVPFQRFTAVRQLLNDLREAGLEPVKSRGIFYGSWRLEKICNRLLDRHPKLFEVAAWLDIQLGSLPGLRWAGRYAIIIARKRQ